MVPDRDCDAPLSVKMASAFMTKECGIQTRVETIVLLGKQIISDVWKSLAVVTDRFSKDIPFPMSMIYGRFRRFCYKLSSPNIWSHPSGQWFLSRCSSISSRLPKDRLQSLHTRPRVITSNYFWCCTSVLLVLSFNISWHIQHLCSFSWTSSSPCLDTMCCLILNLLLLQNPHIRHLFFILLLQLPTLEY